MIPDGDKLARSDDLANLVEELHDENMAMRAVLRRHIRTYRVDDQAWDKEAEADRLMRVELESPETPLQIGRK